MADSAISDRLILVAGMHRSGTSALTRVFNLLGAHIPEPVVPAFRGNEHGHWEPEAVVHMNDRFLADAGGQVNMSVPVDPEWFRSVAAARAADEIARFLRPQLEAHALVVVKDPRISLLAPVWRRAVEGIGVTPRFVLPFRRPQEVAASLARRQLRFFPEEVWPLQRGVMIWLTHVVELERATRGVPRSFIGFDELLLSWRPGVERVLRQIEAPLPVPDEAIAQIEASIRGDSRREFARDEDDAPPMVTRVLAALHACTDDPAASPTVFDAAAAQLAALRLLTGGYLRELEAKAEGWGDLQAEARRAAAERDEARGEVRRLELRAASTARATAKRDAERARLAPIASADALPERLDGVRDAHALAAAREDAERQARRSEALMAAQRDRADDARRERDRHAARLRTEASLRADLEAAAAGERLRTEALVRELSASHAEAARVAEAHAAAMAEAVLDHQSIVAEAVASAEARAAAAREQLGVELGRARAYAATLAQEKLASVAEAEARYGEAQAERGRAEAESRRLLEEQRRHDRARIEAERTADVLAAELAGLRRTLSWRVTAPLRRIRARLR